MRLSRVQAQRAIRRMLRRLQDELCPICGGHMPLRHENKHLYPTLDHVIPRSLGGANAIGNLLVAHAICNVRKGSSIPTGCQIIWLLAINNRLGVKPDRI